MIKRISLLVAIGLFGIVGCKSNSDMKHDSMNKMSTDACSHCPGDQTATAEGKCPTCGMAMMPMKK